MGGIKRPRNGGREKEKMEKAKGGERLKEKQGEIEREKLNEGETSC